MGGLIGYYELWDIEHRKLILAGGRDGVGCGCEEVGVWWVEGMEWGVGVRRLGCGGWEGWSGVWV